MRLPSDFLDRVRDHFRVSEIVGKYIPVKRAGREFHACCPFHNEKTPSFTINDTKGFYHCFGCGAHGDVIGFVKDYEKLSYMEAVEKIAGMAGIPMPVMDMRAQEQYDARKKIYEALELATQFFAVQLNAPEAMKARSYLQERGLSSETLQRFRMGYAPADKNALRQFLLQKGIRLPEAIAAGLLIEGGYGEPYSRFQARIMFPILDPQKRVVAFGGRVLPDAPTTGAASAKYINSPETELFHKGQMLFNAANARKAVTQSNQTLVVVEGYMDVIALAQAGHDAAVAALGTSMTDAHLQLLWRMTPEPVVCLDGDAAGIRAMQRALELALPLMAPDAGLKFVTLPNKHDPDSLVKAHGLSAFQQALAGAQPMSMMIWQQGLDVHGSTTPEARARLEQAVMSQCDKVKNQTSQRHLRDFLRQQLRALNFISQRAGARYDKSKTQTNPMPTLPPVASTKLQAAQETMLAFLLVAPELLHNAEIEDFIGHMEVLDNTLKALHQGLLDAYHRHHHDTTDVLDAAVKKEVWGLAPPRVQSLLRHAMPATSQHLGDADSRKLNLLTHWHKLHEAYYAASLEDEMQQLIQDLAGENGEAALERMNQVQTELARLKERRFALENLN